MKSVFYVVHSHDGQIVKSFKRLKSALCFVQKLIASDKWCYFSQWNENICSMETLYLHERDFHS